MKASTVYSLQKLSKDRTALLWQGKISVEKKVIINFPVMSAITSITAFLGVFCTFFLPPAYTLPFLGRMVLYLEIFFSLSQHYFTQNSTATTSEKQKSMWYSISHTSFVFLQDTAHNRSEYYHICIITKHINPPVKLSSSDSEVIPHGIRHRLPRLKLPNLRQREGRLPLRAMESIQTWFSSGRHYTFRRLSILQPLVQSSLTIKHYLSTP